jgi:2-polyprenyl-3-methyl-5-hydroxy-6-metoxy-1,4-benzoquinol methylase
MTVGQIYKSGTYLENNPTWHQEDSLWKAAQIQKIIERNQLKLKTIAEIGCGAGEILNQLKKTLSGPIQFSGFEISPQAYELCSSKQTDNLTFYLQDLLSADYEFDLLMAIDVFEHIEDYLGFLRKLKSKAQFKIFHIPLDLSVQSVLRATPILRRRKKVGHLHYFTKETALLSLQDTGYRIIDYFYTKYSFELPNKDWKTRLGKYPLKALFAINEDFAVRLLGGCSLLVLCE